MRALRLIAIAALLFARSLGAAESPGPQTFTVLFGFDSATLTADGRRTVEAAAGAYRRTGEARVAVTGHTDLTGSAAYDQRLSERRAQAVASELEHLGVPAGAIATLGVGQADPAVPTPVGVREARNRRVVIAVEMAPALAAAPEPPPAAPAAEAESSGWKFTIAPYLWGASLDGDATIGPVTADVDLSFGDIVKDMSFGGMIFIDARKDKFGLFLNPMFLRTNDKQSGDLDTEVTSDTAFVAGGASYRIAEWTIGTGSEGRPLKVSVEPYAGVRWYYLRGDVKLRDGDVDLLPNRSYDRNDNWFDGIGGLRLYVDVTERLFLALSGDGGTGGSDYAWNAFGSLNYRTNLFGIPGFFGIGYRAMQIKRDTDGFQWDVLYQGPVIGQAFEF